MTVNCLPPRMPNSPVASPRRSRFPMLFPRRISISLALAATFGAVIAITTAALFIALESGRQSTTELARDRSDRIIDTILERTRLHLEPARDQSRFLAKLIADGRFDTSDEPV